jgi:hypothetical protein
LLVEPRLRLLVLAFARAVVLALPRGVGHASENGGNPKKFLVKN